LPFAHHEVTTLLPSQLPFLGSYAIIGGVGPAEFYAKAVGAVPIEGSTPGIYAGMLSNR
jgi:hypothetical protein